MEEEFLKIFLDKAVEDSEKEIKEKGTLSQTNAISLLMKVMFNHVTELKANMATKDDIANMATKDDIARIEKNIERLEKGFSRFEFLLLFSFGLLSVIVILTQIFIK